MAQYKVPQDVEADDKLLGPFSFRQFVYLMIAGAMIALGVGLFQLFPVLAIIPLPFVFLFGALALPIKKDQPMETYLVAIVSYYLKPKTQLWKSGQRESTIEITAPKIVEEERTRSITGEEATHRLSFLADIVDTGGQAIKERSMNHTNEALAVEAENTRDIFESSNFTDLDNTIQQNETERHNAVIEGMKEQIQKSEELDAVPAQTAPKSSESTAVAPGAAAQPTILAKTERDTSGETSRTEWIAAEQAQRIAADQQKSDQANQTKQAQTFSENSSIIELANNPDYSVATIAKEANRIKERMEGEVFISLH